MESRGGRNKPRCLHYRNCTIVREESVSIPSAAVAPGFEISELECMPLFRFFSFFLFFYVRYGIYNYGSHLAEQNFITRRTTTIKLSEIIKQHNEMIFFYKLLLLLF